MREGIKHEGTKSTKMNELRALRAFVFNLQNWLVPALAASCRLTSRPRSSAFWAFRQAWRKPSGRETPGKRKISLPSRLNTKSPACSHSWPGRTATFDRIKLVQGDGRPFPGGQAVSDDHSLIGERIAAAASRHEPPEIDQQADGDGRQRPELAQGEEAVADAAAGHLADPPSGGHRADAGPDGHDGRFCCWRHGSTLGHGGIDRLNSALYAADRRKPSATGGRRSSVAMRSLFRVA